MDPRVLVAVSRNDIHAFKKLVEENKRFLERKTVACLDSVLHIASKLGHAEMAAEIVKLRPDMVSEKNIKLQTPLHEACRAGNLEVVQLLLETNPLVATELNFESQTPFSIACKEGHLCVVKLLLRQSCLMETEEKSPDSTPLHIATLRGHTDIVKEILQEWPNFARKIDRSGCTPLHCACSKGLLEITKLLLSFDSHLALLYSNYGYTPLHLAVINGHLSILEAFISISPNALRYLTTDGETVFHLAVRFNRYSLVVLLTQLSYISDLLHQQDRDGNTLLHLAVSTDNYQLMRYIFNTPMDINSQNDKGQTAFDILEQAGKDQKLKELNKMLKEPGDDQERQLSSLMPELGNNTPENAQEQADTEPIEAYQRSEETTDLKEKITTLLQFRSNHKFRKMPNPRLDENCDELGTNQGSDDLNQVKIWSEKAQELIDTDNEVAQKLEEPSPDKKFTISLQSRSKHKFRKMSNPKMDIETNQGADDLNQDPRMNQHKSLSQIRREELCEIRQNRHNKQYMVHREALQNARNTIILVSILIASVTFTVGLNPPGSVNQEKGQAIAGRKMAFKIFVICNSIALFTSLCIVIVLVSIIPFQRKKLMRLMMITHKVMWIAVSFMATAFVAATWVLIPNDRNTIWMVEALLAIGSGSMATVFIYLGVQLAKHCLRKRMLRKQKSKNNKIVPRFGDEAGIQSESSNSDVDSAVSIGYHTY